MNSSTIGRLAIEDHNTLLEQNPSYQEKMDVIRFEHIKVEPCYPETSSPSPEPDINEEEEVPKGNDDPMMQLSTFRDQRTSVQMNSSTTGRVAIEDHNILLEQNPAYQENMDIIKFENIKVEPYYPEPSSPSFESDIKEEAEDPKQNDEPMMQLSTSGEQRKSIKLETKIESDDFRIWENEPTDFKSRETGPPDHSMSRTEKELYKCSVCQEAFASESEMRKHAVLHTGVQPNQCNVCGKEFTRRRYINLHMMIHTGKKPYECSVCSKAFPTQSAVRRHEAIHRGEKPFECSVCRKAFESKNAWKVMNAVPSLGPGPLDQLHVACEPDNMAQLMVKKRKCFLSFGEKQKIIERSKSCASKSDIIREFGISSTTYYSVLRKEKEIAELTNSYEFKKKKTSKSTPLDFVESSLFRWFMEKRDMGIPINGPILQSKAQQFNQLHNGVETFKASRGWLHNFKLRHGIRQLRMEGDILSNNDEAAEQASAILREKIEQEGCNPENVYNADESGCEFRVLPDFTVASFMGKKAPGYIESEDRFTALFCSNAKGTHRLPLLTIGKSAKPRCIKDLQSLPVVYTHSEKAWMNQEILLHWYKNVFIPKVLEHQKENGITGKVLLILDNAPAHPKAQELNAINENFQVSFLPPNVTALVQPQAQGIIAATKKLYKIELLRELLLTETGESAQAFLECYNLEDAFRILSNVWSSLSESTLRKPWKKLLGDLITGSCVDSVPTSQIREDFADFLVRESHHSESQLSKEEAERVIENWIETDNDDCGWEPSTDRQIAKSVAGGNGFDLDDIWEPMEEVELQKVDCEQDQSEDSTEISANEACGSALILEKWLRRNENCTAEELLFIEKLRNKAAEKVASEQTLLSL